MERINKPIIQRVGNDAIYGNGLDGDATVNSDVTITSDMYYNNLTITGTGFLRTNGYRVFVKNTLTINSGGQIGIGPTSGNDPTDVPTKTVGGHTTGAISYRIGGQGGGATDPNIPVLPSFLLKDINVLSNGLVFHPTLGIVALQGGSAGTSGATGATTPALTNSDTWTGKAGAAGSPGNATSNAPYNTPNPDANTEGVPGGRGSSASPGNATGATPGVGGSGGSGGSGGPVVCVIARVITGSGSIVSRGKLGSAGLSGSTGNPGTQGSNGTSAPNKSEHVANTQNPPVAQPDARNFSYSHTNTRHSDFFAHATKAANHHSPASHTAAVPKGPAAHHRPATHYDNPHHHHSGGRHHPHNDPPHGGMHHWHNSSWHRRYQISTANAITHNHVKPNGHHAGHNGAGNGHHYADYYHQHAGGTNNNAHYGHARQASSHAPAPTNHANYHHHHVAPTPGTSHTNPNRVFPGGAGGVNNGTTTGRAAPAVTGGSGKSGGSGGGGAILVITDNVSGTITYNTSARSATDLDNFSASNGSAYVLIN